MNNENEAHEMNESWFEEEIDVDLKWSFAIKHVCKITQINNTTECET